MSNVGIICDLVYARHLLFRYYFHAIENLYGTPVVVNYIEQLDGLEILFMGDDHHEAHRKIWQMPGFIELCNEKNIKVVVFTNERVLNSYFPWNEDIYKQLQGFKNLYHYMSDVDDCIALGKKVHRCTMSVSYKDRINQNLNNKKDKVVFIGATICSRNSYDKRLDCLDKLGKLIDIDIINTGNPSRDLYFQTISEYRFVLSPIGNGNFFSMRFYETLAVKSIPVLQILDNTFDYYDIEATFKDCIYFKQPEELPEKLANFTLKTSYNELWLEDCWKVLLKEDGLL